MADNLVFFNLGVLVFVSGVLLPAFLYALNRLVRRLGTNIPTSTSRDNDFSGSTLESKEAREANPPVGNSLVSSRWNARIFLALLPISVFLVSLIFLIPGLSVSHDPLVLPHIKNWVFGFSATLLVFVLCLSLYFNHKGDFHSISSQVDAKGEEG
jgi:hypothetical protein